MIVIDGNDGVGKSTLVAALTALGYQVQDRGLPTQATDHGLPDLIPDDELYLILDAPEEVCRARLAQAGKDLTEYWHTTEALTFYRARFREVAAALDAPLIDASGSPEEVLAAVLVYLDAPSTALRIGIPKGRLFDVIVETMAQAGYPMEVLPRNYHPRCQGVRPFILKPRAIPQMVALGLLDAGFCGQDLLLESGYEDRLAVAVDLGVQPVQLVAAAADPGILTAPSRRPLVIATEFPLIADRWATGRNLAHICIQTWGTTEAWVPEYADLLVDVVETGTTLAAHGLMILERLLSSTTVLITAAAKRSHARHHRFVAAMKSLSANRPGL